MPMHMGRQKDRVAHQCVCTVLFKWLGSYKYEQACGCVQERSCPCLCAGLCNGVGLYSCVRGPGPVCHGAPWETSMSASNSRSTWSTAWKNGAGMGCGGRRRCIVDRRCVDATLDQMSCSCSWNATGQIRLCSLCEYVIMIVY